MKAKITELITQVKNPKTGESLLAEGFIGEIHATESAITVEYQCDPFTMAERDQIEKDVSSQLLSMYSQDVIIVMAISENDKDECESGTCGCGHNHDHDDHHHGHEHHGHDHHGHHQAQNPFNKRRVEGVKKIIAISSGKGGVGKSTVAANLAIALKNCNKKVGVVDADIYGPSLPILLGKRDAKPFANEHNKIIPIESHGISFLSFGLFVEEKDPVVWRGPMLGGVLNQFLFDADWGELDYLIIDMPPGTGDMQLSLAQNVEVDGAIVVSTPQDVALLDSNKGKAMFDKVNVPVLGMIENMSSFICEHGTEYFIFGKGGVEKACQNLKTDFLGSIPIEIELRESSDNGHPYMANNKYEGRSVWTSYMTIAKTVEGLLK